ncbi:MAG TPA: hypothetical protein VEW42_03935 [Candidatus Eisenbacteria bacterium]|nr:hypothetical protein [Candidatus Eisenbacteria bacterium]
MNIVKKSIFVFAGLVLLSGTFLSVVSANNDKVNVCHLTGSQTNPFVAQSINANELQSHLDNGDFLYNGPLHNALPDNKGGVADDWCNNNIPSAVTPSPSPVIDPCANNACGAPIATPTAMPTNAPSNNGGSTSNDSGDGLGCATHDCSGNQAGATSAGPIQAVLGASTMAGTGTFENSVMTLMLVAGLIVLSLGGISFAKENK